MTNAYIKEWTPDADNRQYAVIDSSSLYEIVAFVRDDGERGAFWWFNIDITRPKSRKLSVKFSSYEDSIETAKAEISDRVTRMMTLLMDDAQS